MSYKQEKTNCTERRKGNSKDQKGKDLEVKKGELCELKPWRKKQGAHREKGKKGTGRVYT